MNGSFISRQLHGPITVLSLHFPYNHYYYGKTRSIHSKEGCCITVITVIIVVVDGLALSAPRDDIINAPRSLLYYY